MLIKTNASIEFLQKKIFSNERYGVPKYQSKIEPNSLFIVFENFTLTNSNYMTISIVLEDKGENRFIHFVQAGASSGIFGFDWGAGHRRQQQFIKSLKEENITFEILKE